MNLASKTTNKVIWAVDPFEAPLKSKSLLLANLSKVANKQNALVEPVYVLNLTDGMQADAGPPSELARFTQYKRAAEKAVQTMVEEIEGISFLPSKILVAEDASSTEQARILSSYAKTTHASLILVGTHARHGLSRVFLGSFTETLILHADLPVITIGPACQRAHSSQSGELLFATDLGKHAEEVFPKVCRFARTLGLPITLFYSIPPRMEPVLQSLTYLLSGGWLSVPEYLSDEELFKRARAESWAQHAKAMGIVLNINFAVTPGNIPDLIVDYARTNGITWIAMASESSAIKTNLIGSIVREVVRNAPCPAWIFRTQKEPYPDPRRVFPEFIQI